MQSDPSRWDKYLYICYLAFKKYAEPGQPAVVCTHRGGVPTRYQRVCDFAFDYFCKREADD